MNTKTMQPPISRSKHTVRAVLGTLGGLATMGAVIGLLAWRTGPAPVGAGAEVGNEQVAEVKRLAAKNAKLLNHPPRKDEASGAVRLPIGVAMERYVIDPARPATRPVTGTEVK